MTLVSTLNSSYDIAFLTSRMDDLFNAVNLLSERIDQIVDDRVKNEVAAATSQLGQRVNELLVEVKSAKTAQEEVNQKLDKIISRVETHGKRKKFLGIF